MQTPDGQQFGPVPRQELDAWLGQGRITAECQLLLEGTPQWQWASEIYPVLASQTPSSMPSFGGAAKKSSDSSGSGSFDFLTPAALGNDTNFRASGATAPDSLVSASGSQAVSDSIITGGSFVATSPSPTGRKSSSKSTAGKKSRKQSGLVTAVAIVNYVMGGLNILGGIAMMLIGLFGGALLAELIKNAERNNPNLPGGASAIGGAFAMVFAIIGMVAILMGTVTVIAGYGIAERRQWGRILSFVLAGLNGLFVLACLVTLQPVGIFSLGYCIFVFVALLQKEAATEFR
jgi:hypothetical protein